MSSEIGTLERIIEEIKFHDERFPNHGVGCTCHDEHARAIRRLLKDLPPKTRQNFLVVLGYIYRNS